MDKRSSRSFISKFSFAMGNLGHAAFYGALSNYFIVFVTAGLFSELDPKIAAKLIGLITSLIVLIRIVEIFIDPLLGNIVDNTKTKWGKFKPWIIIGNVVSAVIMIILFTGIFNLANVNWIAFAILFVILFVVLDVFYSFSDVSYWGMVPALSDGSKERGLYTALGSFTGSVSWNGLTIIVVPIVTYFTYLATGKHTQGAPGWLAFAVIISLLAVLCAFIVAWGTEEKDDLIRTAAKPKTTIKDVFIGLAQNDQILWASLAYFMYSLANVITNGVLYYFFKFVLGRPESFQVAGWIAIGIGLLTSPLYPLLNRFIPRKYLFSFGQCCMIVSYLIFIFGRQSMGLLIIGLVLYNITFAQLVTVLTLTDAIEYGQLKTGERNEAVVLAVRPMIDKLCGAFANGIVGYIAIAAGMTGSATAADMTTKNIRTFEGFAFYVPLVLAVLALVIFLTKVKLTEEKHEEIVEELKDKLALGDEKLDLKVTEEKTRTTNVLAPISGQIEALPSKAAPDFNALGFVILPTTQKVYAPFSGTIRFTFSTKHVLGIVAHNGLEAIIHVGIDTVKLRGKGFVTHYNDGQTVKAGDLLLEFDLELIKQAGLNPNVIVFFTQPKAIAQFELTTDHEVSHGELVATVTLEQR
ncbi:glycoside-pentoside-hexuronide (GPH):cation symporter [Ligilactobacillus faecis]|uniref:Glycoside-pentoside-hexuronide (GPH):cation symporter n=1 Tax=Ligilactobacillus faecis TaxID=762833 RepID=A0ABV4DM92_9LACO